MGPKSVTLWIFSEIIAFSTSLDLSIDPDLMSHLINSTCSGWTASFYKIFVTVIQ
jgi:hypothetical protein